MENKMIEVRNRDAGSVGYIIPDQGIRRTFSPGESKKIALEELQALQYVPGGEFTLKHLLMVNDRDALSALNMETEPEYFYTEKEVKELLTTGTLDQLKDCLDFAPQGTLDLVKQLAVDLRINDINKREAIKEKMGFDVTKAIEFNKEVEEEVPTEAKVRRSASIPTEAAATATPARRYVVTQK